MMAPKWSRSSGMYVEGDHPWELLLLYFHPFSLPLVKFEIWDSPSAPSPDTFLTIFGASTQELVKTRRHTSHNLLTHVCRLVKTRQQGAIIAIRWGPDVNRSTDVVDHVVKSTSDIYTAGRASSSLFWVECLAFFSGYFQTRQSVVLRSRRGRFSQAVGYLIFGRTLTMARLASKMNKLMYRPSPTSGG